MHGFSVSEREKKSHNRLSLETLIDMIEDKKFISTEDIIQEAYSNLSFIDHSYDILSRICALIKQIKAGQWPESEVSGIVGAFNTARDKVSDTEGMQKIVSFCINQSLLEDSDSVVKNSSSYIESVGRCHLCLKEMGKITDAGDIFRIRLHQFRKKCRYASTLLI